MVPDFFKRVRAIIPLALFVLTSPAPCLADNWQAAIHENGAPKALVGVDKKKRTFNFFEKRSPLGVRYQYPCVTGQITGDKQKINDLKTPEGVYFVDYKIAHGLDFREYGGIAYTLNYPNPVDRLRGKTGHGIWIHSKGFDLVPTRGCIAINRENIAEVGPRLIPGLPVILAEELRGVTTFDNGTPAQMISLMEGWTNAWASKSPQMFDYYDPEAYSRATEDFSLFRQNKERLFKALDFIKIYNREIHALEGPGYWVTWAEQLYTASNLSTEGVRRLYWQKDPQGLFRIVGMEWIPRDLGMAAEYRQGKLVASLPQTVSDASGEAPIAPSLDMPEQAAETPEAEASLPQPAPAPVEPPAENRTSPGLGETIRAIAGKFLAASDPLIPGKTQKAPLPDEIEWGSGRKLGEPAKSPEAEVAPVNREPGKAAPENPVQQEPAEAKAVLAGSDKAALEKALARWQMGMENRDQGILELYDSERFNKLPRSAGVPKTQSLAAISQGMKRDFSQKGLFVSRPAVFEGGPEIVKSSQDILLILPRQQRQGVQNLWWSKNGAGDYRIVGSQFTPRPLGLEANYLEKVSGDVADMVEAWRKAWEQADIDGYMSHYLPDASQPGRTGASVIRMQKSGLWTRVKPVMVQLSGLRLSVEPDGIRADMNQAYTDSAGRGDKGVKTLHLRHDGDKWRIKREDWTALPGKDQQGALP